MDPISSVISTRADDLFQSQATANDTVIESAVEANDDDLFQEEILIKTVANHSLKQSNTNIDVTKLKTMMHAMRDQLDAMLRFINGDATALPDKTANNAEVMPTGELIVEGIFNGEKMIDSSGKEYAVPPNYASKSKLVEGDKMKLTITKNGRFIYKQISQIERKRLVGELILNSANGQWNVIANGKNYKVLTASITFYKGISGDEVVFFASKNNDSSWGAIEHIIHKK